MSAIERYFLPRSPQFWRWSKSGCAEIEGVWESATLIVFREELAQILTELQPQGWPPLSSLLLVCAASRESWPTTRGWLRSWLLSESPDNPFVRDLIDQLDDVHALPRDLRESTAAKVRLLRVIFEGRPPAVATTEVGGALKYLTSVMPHLDPALFSSGESEPAATLRFADWTRGLRQGLTRLHETALRNRQETSLDETVVPAPITLPAEQATHSARLWAWSNDPQLAGVARIARRLLSVVSWPRSLSQPDELPQGGVSDLTNRGPLDRLLLTELAQDDELLMVRLALNEALYIRRECPSQQTPLHRAILVDAGLRMWGRPRVFAAAVALAMAAAQDRESLLTVNVGVTTPHGWQPVDVSTRTGVVELLAALSPALHPGDVLAEWQNTLEAEVPDAERIIVTTPEAFRQPEFQRSLGELPTAFRVALVDGDGRFELRAHTSHGWRTECAAELDLEDLLQPPASNPSLPLTTSEPARVPAIFRADPFPLLLTHPIHTQQCFPAPGGKLLTLASGGRLLLWKQPQRAGQQLATDIPRGRIVAWRTMSEDEPRGLGDSNLTAAVLRASRWLLLLVDLDDRSRRIVPLQATCHTSDHSVRVVLLPECVLFLSRRGIEACSYVTGERLTQSNYSIGVLKSYGNRYLRDAAQRWFRLSFDGTIHLEPVNAAKETLLLIEPPLSLGRDEPVELTPDAQGELNHPQIPPFRGSNLVAVEQRDDLVILRGQFESLNGQAAYRGLCYVIWDRQSSGWSWRQHYVADVEQAVQHTLTSQFRPRQYLRPKFAAIRCEPNGVYLLSAKRKHWWKIQLSEQGLSLVPQNGIAPVATPIPFERLRLPATTIPIHAAQLPNGTTVWIDGRGLMHLFSADRERPEVTLVMDERHLSGWISDGRLFGISYYHANYAGGSELIPEVTAWRSVLAPLFGIVP